jgi:hypothetical protein
MPQLTMKAMASMGASRAIVSLLRFFLGMALLPGQVKVTVRSIFFASASRTPISSFCAAAIKKCLVELSNYIDFPHFGQKFIVVTLVWTFLI